MRQVAALPLQPDVVMPRPPAVSVARIGGARQALARGPTGTALNRGTRYCVGWVKHDCGG